MTPDQTRLWWYLAAVSVAAFTLNWLWEMMQMPGFVELAEKSWPDTAGVCTIATLGDLVMTLTVFALGALAAGKVQWGIPGAWNVYATAALLGGLFAAAFEWFSLATGHWHYSDAMPIVPLLNVDCGRSFSYRCWFPFRFGLPDG